MDTCTIIFQSFLIGVAGDTILQLLAYTMPDNQRPFGNIKDLEPYFKQHGIFESVLIAGGIMLLSTWTFFALQLPYTYPVLFIYGGVLDIIWRQFNLMPSLTTTYYKSMTPLYSVIWGGIPMVMVKMFTTG